MQIVWFKRDLRIEDHAPLAAAAADGRVLPLFILEPDLWRQPDLSGRHYDFLGECLAGLDNDLSALGQPLVLRVGDAVDILSELCAEHNVTTIRVHQETWNGWTYERDRRVNAWARKAGVRVIEDMQFGVHRRQATRRGWAGRWDRMMAEPTVAPPRSLAPVNVASDPWPDPVALGIAEDHCPHRQSGGRRAGLERLTSFLSSRGEAYRFSMSSPVTAASRCSRISPYLAFGCLSMREVWQACRAGVGVLADRPPETRRAWRQSLKSLTAVFTGTAILSRSLRMSPLRSSAPSTRPITVWTRTMRRQRRFLPHGRKAGRVIRLSMPV